MFLGRCGEFRHGREAQGLRRGGRARFRRERGSSGDDDDAGDVLRDGEMGKRSSLWVSVCVYGWGVMSVDVCVCVFSLYTGMVQVCLVVSWVRCVRDSVGAGPERQLCHLDFR